jgi:hypothetical protein
MISYFYLRGFWIANYMYRYLEIFYWEIPSFYLKMTIRACMWKQCRCTQKLNTLWIYRCTNSWEKKPFNLYNSSRWIVSLFWLLNWFQACFQSDNIVVSHRRTPYCLHWLHKCSSSNERIKTKRMTVLLFYQKARKRCILIL